MMEDGAVTLIGATTEKPSFEFNAALFPVRACWCFAPDGGGARGVAGARRAPDRQGLAADAEARAALIGMADGDGRAVLTLAEEVGAPRGRRALDALGWSMSCSDARPSTTRRRTVTTT